jgi:hypothetical protein
LPSFLRFLRFAKGAKRGKAARYSATGVLWPSFGSMAQSKAGMSLANDDQQFSGRDQI